MAEPDWKKGYFACIALMQIELEWEEFRHEFQTESANPFSASAKNRKALRKFLNGLNLPMEVPPGVDIPSAGPMRLERGRARNG